MSANPCYIGITGFMPTDPIRPLTALLPGRARAHLGATHPGPKLMVGILASEKTLNGIKNKWPHRYPEISEIGSIVEDDNRVLNLVHYNTKGTDVALQLGKIHTLAGMPNRLDGFQLNIPWTDPDQIEGYLQWADRNLEDGRSCQYIVQQIGGHAFEVISHDPKRLVDRLEQYGESIDYILLDPSGGLGQYYTADHFRPYLDELYSEYRSYGVGIAGGLSPGNLKVVAELAAEYPFLSIDAEGRLRDENDDLDIGLASAYLKEALYIMQVFEG
ncbi:MAG: hypothetical protein PHW75_01330 [Patescibacteria group bacterium]|nr:hypothetical protein [Patescibacteria group bacterium]